METFNVVGASLEEIAAAISDMGEPSYRARQIYYGIYRRLLRSWDQFTDLSKDLRKKLEQRLTINYPSMRRAFVSHDGTRRYLFEVAPGQYVESVYIPEKYRDTFCISTQVGCAVGCLFCATGKLPFQRNLSIGEIVGQVLFMKADRCPTFGRVNVVIMGMGEPLLNYDHVMRAIGLMTDPRGMAISPRRVTLSTSGVIPGIRKLAEESVIPARPRFPLPKMLLGEDGILLPTCSRQSGGFALRHYRCGAGHAYSDQQKVEHRSPARSLS